MQISEESKFPIPTPSPDRQAQRAASLAVSLAKQLSTGEYISQSAKTPSFFLKVDAWDRSLYIDELDLKNEKKVDLSNGLTVTLDEEDLNGVLDNGNKLRFILLAENGFSSFTVTV